MLTYPPWLIYIQTDEYGKNEIIRLPSIRIQYLKAGDATTNIGSSLYKKQGDLICILIESG